MLIDAVSFGIGGFVGTVVGYLLCALMTISKRSDEQGNRMVCPTCYQDSDHCQGHYDWGENK